MKKGGLLKIFVTIIITMFFCQLGFSQETKSIETAPEIVKIYGAPVQIIPSTFTESSDNNNSNNLQANIVTNPQKPISAKAKLKLGLEKAFFNPNVYIFPAITAIRQQINERSPNKDTGDKAADGLSRYAINYGTASTKALLVSGVYPIIFKQNPHYQPSTKRNVGRRILHAASRVFIGQTDNGDRQFNYSQIVGDFSASAIANVWERNSLTRERVGVGPTFRRFGNTIGVDIIRFIVIKEFGPDIKKFILRH